MQVHCRIMGRGAYLFSSTFVEFYTYSSKITKMKEKSADEPGLCLDVEAMHE